MSHNEYYTPQPDVYKRQKIDSEKTAKREFGNLLKIQDNYPKIVITEDSFEGNSYEGIRHCPIRQFLMECI